MHHLHLKNIGDLFVNYIKISKDYFLNCVFPSRHCHKKAVCLDPNYHWTHRAQYNHKYELKTVRDVVEYFKQDGAKSKSIGEFHM